MLKSASVAVIVWPLDEPEFVDAWVPAESLPPQAVRNVAEIASAAAPRARRRAVGTDGWNTGPPRRTVVPGEGVRPGSAEAGDLPAPMGHGPEDVVVHRSAHFFSVGTERRGARLGAQGVG